MKTAKEFAEDVAETMYNKKAELDDESQGTLRVSSHELKDNTNPKLILNKKELRKETGRKDIRKSFIKDLVQELKKHDLDVSIDGNNTLEIKTVSIIENKFTSLSSMR